jgi:hypothetical protein
MRFGLALWPLCLAELERAYVGKALATGHDPNVALDSEAAQSCLQSVDIAKQHFAEMKIAAGLDTAIAVCFVPPVVGESFTGELFGFGHIAPAIFCRGDNGARRHCACAFERD